MEHRYAHILSPLQVGQRILKNRILSTKMASQQLQGPEDYPAEGTIAFYEQIARNGAAVVCCSMGTYPDSEGRRPPMSNIDMTNRAVRSYFSQIADRIHAYGALASASLQNVEPHDVGICYLDNWDDIPMNGDYSMNLENKPTISLDRMQEMIDDFARQAMDFKKLGFDMVTVYMSYRGGILANSLSPVINRRGDIYGGSFENRARLSLEALKSIREACGADFLIECQVSATEEEPGYSFEEFLDYAELAQQYVDIFQLRAYEGALNHGNGFNQKEHEPYMLQYAEGMKQRGIKAVISPVGAFQDLDDIERFIAEGKCDTVSMARAFICDPGYGEKLYEGRGEDVTPCLRCNKCHGGRCSVNPRHGLEHVMKGVFPARPDCIRKIAVIGGGPAGMVAAITAAARGHDVTLYEKDSVLGGQLNHVDAMPFKWPLRSYRDYLKAQLHKSDVHVELGKEATRALIGAGGYEAVIAACGAHGVRPESIQGAELSLLPMDALRDTEIGRRVVVAGGAEIGFETGPALALTGREVTVLTRRKHYPCDMHTLKATRDYIAALPNFTYLKQCTVTVIGKGFVQYMDIDGKTRRIDCDDTVFSGGRAANNVENMEFAGIVPRFFIVGDGRKPANIREAVYSAYMSAMQL